MSPSVEYKEKRAQLVWDEENFITHLKKVLEPLQFTWEIGSPAGIPFRRLPDQIQFTSDESSGSIGYHIDNLDRQTDEDTEDRERAGYFKINLPGQLVFVEQETVGEEDQIDQDYEYQIGYVVNLKTGERKEKRELLAIPMHSHGKGNSPLSPQDFEGILTHDPVLIDFPPELAEVIITPSARYLILRTDETPLLNRDQFAQFIQTWNKAIIEMTALHISANMTQEEMFSAFIQVQIGFISTFCKGMKIGFYQTDGKNNVFFRLV